MKNKLKLILWGKKLQLPEDYDNLEFDGYELKDDKRYKLYLYKNNEVIKLIWYYENKNKSFEYNYKNGKFDEKQYVWNSDGKIMYKDNYKNGKLFNKLKITD